MPRASMPRGFNAKGFNANFKGFNANIKSPLLAANRKHKPQRPAMPLGQFENYQGG